MEIDEIDPDFDYYIERQAALLRIMRSNGITFDELAKVLDIEGYIMKATLDDLIKRGRIEKRGNMYYPAGDQ